MPEFKFSCPNCSQHIQCDTGYAGMQINCPTCRQIITVPPAPQVSSPPPLPPSIRPAGTPPPPPASAPGLATRQSTGAPGAGQRFAGAGAPPPKKKSGALKIVISATAAIVGAAIGFFGVQFALGNLHLHFGKTKANPAAQVAKPTADAAVQALSVLSKVHAAYTNINAVKAEGMLTLDLNLSNLTYADINPGAAAAQKNPKRRAPGLPRNVALRANMSIKTAHTNWYSFVGDAVIKIDRQTISNTFANWSSDKGRFTFSDNHMPQVPAMYMQLPDFNPSDNPAQQFKNVQQLFEDPANLTKIVKDLGQTGDEAVNGEDCYTLTAKVFGQKVKLWVDKSTYLIPQWQITLGGEVSDADIDDAFSLITLAVTNAPAAQLDMAKQQVKKFAPAIAKIRGTVTATTESIELNPTLTADDFNYSVPPGVRLIKMPTMAPPVRRTN